MRAGPDKTRAFSDSNGSTRWRTTRPILDAGVVPLYRHEILRIAAANDRERRESMPFKKLAVLGVGAIGSTIGGYLTRAGHDVTLIDLWPAHVEEMRRGGLKITAQDEEFTVRVKALHLTDVCALRERFDAVVLSV
jgi:threonine dehydrogenase-like Zn-dependent dehydrogenase